MGDNERESKMKQKENKKKQNLKIEQQKERELDGDDLFFDDAEFEFDELQINENVNPTPNRCVLINNFGKLIEICLNDQHLEIIKLNQKKNKNKTAKNDNYDYHQTNISFAGYEMIDFGAFDSLRYEQMNDSQFKVENIVSNVQFLSIIEFIYDDSNEYEICLEFKENENEMMLYFDYSFFSFEDDNEWNEVHHIVQTNNELKKIKKCLNLYQFHRKICIIKYENNKNDDTQNQYDEYRVIIKTQQKREDHLPEMY